MKKIIPALAVCALTLVASPATGHATLLAYESFNTTGNLIGQAGQTGFSGTWAEYKGATGAGAGTTTVYADGLTYSGLLSQGGRAYVSPTGLPASGATAQLSSAVSTGTLYLSFLINIDEGTRYCGLALSATGVSEALLVGRNSTSTEWTLSGGTVTGTSSHVPIAYDTTTLMVLRVDFNASGTNERLRLYINPTTTVGSTDELTANIDMYTTSSLTVNGLTLAAGATNGTVTAALTSFDEIRLGTTLGDVLVVPEVGSFSLALSGLGFLAFLRRKNRR